MANHKDTLKRARQNKVRRARNRSRRTRMRNSIKQLRLAIDGGDKALAIQLLPKTVSLIQKTAQKGVIHKRNAARRVSRLSKAVNGMS